MFEKEAEEIAKDIYIHHFDDDVNYPCVLQAITVGVQQGAQFGYNKANEEHEEKCKTAYIKGIRTMANALKDYDRTEGTWTDYFEHKVEEVLKRLLKEIE